MESLIKILTEHPIKRTELIVDNTTDYKTFAIIETEPRNEHAKETELQLHNNGKYKTLRIGDVTLIGREIELLKEFLNQ